MENKMPFWSPWKLSKYCLQESAHEAKPKAEAANL